MAKRQTQDLIAELTKNLENARPLSEQETPQPAVDRTLEAEALHAASSEENQLGKGVRHSAFWLFDEDRTLLHEISMHLYSQGIKPTNNLILRAAIRLLPETPVLAGTVRELIAADGRTTRHK